MKCLPINDYVKGVEGLKVFLENVPMAQQLAAGAVAGINQALNIQIESYAGDVFKLESLLAEIVVQDLLAGATMDPSSIQGAFTHEHWRNVVTSYMKQD